MGAYETLALVLLVNISGHNVDFIPYEKMISPRRNLNLTSRQDLDYADSMPPVGGKTLQKRGRSPGYEINYDAEASVL